MSRTVAPRSDGADLTDCDREAIQVPGSIQPSGALLVLDGTAWTVLQASENVEHLLGTPVGVVLDKRLEEGLGNGLGSALQNRLQETSLNRDARYLGTITVAEDTERPTSARDLHVIAHRLDDALIVELEPAVVGGPVSFRNLYPLVQEFLTGMERVTTVEELCRFAAGMVRTLTGFDRTLVYRFDDDGAGTVVAEDRNDRLPSYLDHRFPASDIPAQARELYRRNRLRLIADARYTPVPIVPLLDPRTQRPLDLSAAGLRSVSPIHLEYMKNMGTAASMSISILRDGRLWGLLSCHHATPRGVPLEVRTACDLLGQSFSLQLAARERQTEMALRLDRSSLHVSLLAHIAHEDDLVAGLVKHPDELLRFADATGAAVVHDGKCHRVGKTPDETEILGLVGWLSDSVAQDLFETDSLSAHQAEAEAYKSVACGLLALSVSKLYRSYILWFRPEIVQTVTWGGDPRKPVDESGHRLHPRNSFEAWKETVRLRARPWRASERAAVAEFRHAVVGIVLRKTEELAARSAELSRTNEELEAFSYSVSHDLRAPFRHIVGYAELLNEQHELSESGRRYVNTIIESACFAGVLVDNLLAFSQMARAGITPVMVDMDQLVSEVRREVMTDAVGRSVEWRVSPLPDSWADPVMMRLVLRNLLSNAVKYTRKRTKATIEVGSTLNASEVVYFVRDNGTGFDMQYVGKLFGVFQRLHRMEEFEGTGIGLANVRRIIARHGGRTWAEGALDRGATFYFSLPSAVKPSEGSVC